MIGLPSGTAETTTSFLMWFRMDEDVEAFVVVFFKKKKSDAWNFFEDSSWFEELLLSSLVRNWSKAEKLSNKNVS